MNNRELYHFGIKGMKWGVRRYVNEDGTLTNAGKKRYNNGQKLNKKYSGNIGKMYRHEVGKAAINTAYGVGTRLASEAITSSIFGRYYNPNYKESAKKALKYNGIASAGFGAYGAAVNRNSMKFQKDYDNGKYTKEKLKEREQKNAKTRKQISKALGVAAGVAGTAALGYAAYKNRNNIYNYRQGFRRSPKQARKVYDASKVITL